MYCCQTCRTMSLGGEFGESVMGPLGAVVGGAVEVVVVGVEEPEAMDVLTPAALRFGAMVGYVNGGIYGS